MIQGPSGRVPNGSIMTPPKSKQGRQSKFTGEFMMFPFSDSKGNIYIYWVSSDQMVDKEYLLRAEVLRQFRKRLRC